MSTLGESQTVEPEELETPTSENVFEVLSNERRRYVLRAIRLAEEETIDIGTLAELVAAWENDTSPNRVTYDQRKCAYTALQQTHLPKMDQAGAIQFQENRGVVRRVSDTDEFDYYLTVVPGGSFLYSHYYVAASAIGLVLGLLIALDVVPVPYVPELAVAGLMVGLYGLAAGLHLFIRNRARFEGRAMEVEE